jgi:hypothetical protein
MQEICANPLTNGLCVRDAQNQLVGIAQADSQIFRQMQGRWYNIEGFDENEIPRYALFFYSGDNCTGAGTPMMENPGYIVHPASYDGQSFWAPTGPIQTFIWRSIAVIVNGAVSQCSEYTAYCDQPCSAEGGPATKLQTKLFYLPLKLQ